MVHEIVTPWLVFEWDDRFNPFGQLACSAAYAMTDDPDWLQWAYYAGCCLPYFTAATVSLGCLAVYIFIVKIFRKD